MKYLPIVVAVGVGAGDGLVNPAGGAHTIPKGHLYYGGAVVAAGLVGERVLHANPLINYALMTSGVTLLASRIPGAFRKDPATGKAVGLGVYGYSAGDGGGGGGGAPLRLPPAPPAGMARLGAPSAPTFAPVRPRVVSGSIG